MIPRILICLFLLLPSLAYPASEAESPRQLLVTFKNEHAGYQSAAFQPPYKTRKRYAVSAAVRRDARAIAKEYALKEIEQWPLESLSVYCYVFEVAYDRSDGVVAALSKDSRVESAQWLNTFRTQNIDESAYNDAYVEMQHGLDTISLAQAHQLSQGEGTRVAMVDSDVDHRHEDLDGSITRIEHLTHSRHKRDRRHGTAVASVIGANANNAVGMVGVAPKAMIEVAAACWLDEDLGVSVCDTFSLAKALDGMFLDPPHIVNLSLCGPEDALLSRILRQLIDRGVVVVAAAANSNDGASVFPANMPTVISVASIGNTDKSSPTDTLRAPGEGILVAVPSNDYEFRSGSSLATAHVTGIVALLKSKFPDISAAELKDVLANSQTGSEAGLTAVNACRAFELLGAAVSCDAG